jgi:DNA-binding FadR family transcriptional regulator
MLRQMGCVVRVGIKTMKASLRTQPHALPRMPEVQLGEYGRVVRAIETSDGDGARVAMTQVLARNMSLWMEETV